MLVKTNGNFYKNLTSVDITIGRATTVIVLCQLKRLTIMAILQKVYSDAFFGVVECKHDPGAIGMLF